MPVLAEVYLVQYNPKLMADMSLQKVTSTVLLSTMIVHVSEFYYTIHDQL